VVGHKTGQIDRQNIQFLRESAQYGLCRCVPQQFIFQVVYQVSRRQHLMTGAIVADPRQLFCCFFHRVLGNAPKSDINLHSIFRLEALLPELGLLEATHSKINVFCADPFQIPGFFTNNAQPSSHRPLDRREADQIVIHNGLQNCQEGFPGAHVGILTNSLSQTLLESGGQQQLAQLFMHPFITTQYNAPDQGIRHGAEAVFAANDVSNDLLQPGISSIQFIGQHFRRKALYAAFPAAQVTQHILRQITGENITNIRINKSILPKTANHTIEFVSVTDPSLRTKTSAVPGHILGVFLHPVDGGKERILEPGQNAIPKQPGKLLVYKFRRLVILPGNKGFRKRRPCCSCPIIHADTTVFISLGLQFLPDRQLP